MKTGSRSFAVVGPAVLIALFAVGSAAGRVLGLPLPAPIVGLTFVLLGLRIGVMATAFEEASAAPIGRAEAREPMLRAANG